MQKKWRTALEYTVQWFWDDAEIGDYKLSFQDLTYDARQTKTRVPYLFCMLQKF